MTSARDTFHIRELESADELAACLAIEREVWGFEDLDLVPAAQMAASVHAGGLVLGAFEQDVLIAFAYGFPAAHYGARAPLGFHSHMVAVHAPYRGQGLGKRLKFLQRAWCLERNISWMTWTFDPLQAGNARFNLEHLAVYCDTYYVNVYGMFGGELNEGLPTDRLLAFWPLRERWVEKLAMGAKRPPLDLSALPYALRPSEDGGPGDLRLELKASRLCVAIPENITRLMQTEPDLALAWRMAVRRVLEHYVAEGYRIVRFVYGTYVLERVDKNTLIRDQI